MISSESGLDESTSVEYLLTESELIHALALHDRPNPAGAVRWLIRTKRIPVVRVGRGILRFRPEDIRRFIEENLQE